MSKGFPTKFRKALKEIELEEYISEHTSPESSALSSIVWRAEQDLVYPRMVSGHLQGWLLTILVRMLRPRLILEIGTYAGYATVAMASGLSEGGRVITLELDSDLEPFIMESLYSAGVADRVDPYFGDAQEWLIRPEMPIEKVDLVYIDANKRHYTTYYQLLRRRMRPGTFILADNVLWGGKVVDASAHDLQTEGIRAFNKMVSDDPSVDQVLLPIRDGLTLISIK